MSDPSTILAAIGAALGRAVLAIGLLVLSFAGYQLWGTGLAESTSQEQLANQLAERLERVPAPPRLSSSSAWLDQEPGFGQAEPADAALIVDATTPDKSADGVADPRAEIEPIVARDPIAVGQPFASLRIPTIDVDKTVVEGTTREALRTGPGHYLGTARPGEIGNVAIAGHRTTYGAPFQDIDQLDPGDPIIVETEDGVFTYRVEGQATDDGEMSGHRIVTPEEVGVIADLGDHRLTLTACHPLYSARQRIIVTAVLDQPPAPAVEALPTVEPEPEPEPEPAAAMIKRPTTMVSVSVPVPLPTIADAGADGLGWQPINAKATIAWGALSAAVAAAALVLGRLWRRLPAYLMAVPSFTLCLLTCFSHLDRLLPAS